MKIIIFFLGISTFCFSQKISFIYETKYKPNPKETNYAISDSMILDFENNISIFRESQDRIMDSLKLSNGREIYKTGVENQFYVKKNLTQKSIEKVITYLGTDYLLPINENLNWKITPEQKTIGKYKSQKAETNYGGRNWIAWFTTELPFSDGPYIFNGLPGLIVSIQDSNNEYSFNLIELKKGGNIFDARTKTIKIDWKKYETLAKSYFNDPADINSKVGRKITAIDSDGNEIELSGIINDLQKDVLENNNPIELNHKIKYK